MSTNVVNQTPFLRTTREFPLDLYQLCVEVNRSYVDIANNVNARTIGVFPANKSAITGESWFLTPSRQQTLRQVYPISSTSAINHNLNVGSITSFVRMFGTFTDGTNYYGLISGSNSAIPGQISFYITPTQIVFNVGTGAPALTSGIVVLEWLTNV
ncbi:MAG: hypothetical protein ACSNEK_10055 [Parachlamydiaceae bacterium]